MRIRDARPEDVVRIVELLQQLSPEREKDPRDPAYVKALREIVEHDARNRVLVAVEGGEIVGTAELFFRPNLSHGGRPIAEIESVVVDGNWRRRGIGQTLMRFCVDLARGAGCVRVQLTSNWRRKEAHRFYEQLGFTASHLGFKLYL